MHKILSVVALAFLLATSLAAEAQSPCKCAEMRDLKNRFCTARAAMREYDRVASKVLADEKKAGKPILLTSEIKGNIVKCVQEALDTADDIGAQFVQGGTDANCDVTGEVVAWRNGPPTDCIEKSVSKHEGFHRERCLEREKGKWQKVWTEGAPVASAMIDTKFAMTAVDFMAEEQAAYMMEEEELRETLRQLANKCKPAEKVVTISDNDDVAGKQAGDKYNLDPSLEPCPSRPRKTPSACK